MSIIRRISAVLGIACVLIMIFVFLCTKNSNDFVFIGCFTAELLSKLAFLLAFLFFGIAVLMLGLEKKRDNEKRAKSCISGGLALLAVFVVIAAAGGRNMGAFVHKVKSPDGKHALYYFKDDDQPVDDTYVYCRRTGMFTYERVFWHFGTEKPALDWGKDSVSYMGGEYTYSSNGK